MAHNTSRTRDGSMTVEEAGRKGGLTTAETHGSEFYSQIGRKGGEAVSQNREHMAQIGRKGGESSGRARAEQRARMAAIANAGKMEGEKRSLGHSNDSRSGQESANE